MTTRPRTGDRVQQGGSKAGASARTAAKFNNAETLVVSNLVRGSIDHTSLSFWPWLHSSWFGCRGAVLCLFDVIWDVSSVRMVEQGSNRAYTCAWWTVGAFVHVAVGLISLLVLGVGSLQYQWYFKGLIGLLGAR